jgi:hypothetical protein
MGGLAPAIEPELPDPDGLGFWPMPWAVRHVVGGPSG